MRIEKITLHNFRQYRDSTIVFPFSENDLHVVLGEGGCGKTTLLNAIEWCLYANEPHLAKANTDYKSVPVYNLAAMQDLLNSGTRKDRVQVSIEFSNENGRYTIQRVQNVYVDPRNEICYQPSTQATFTVKKTAECIPKFYNDESAEDEIAKFMPAEVGKFFFFDGEQLDNFFERVPDMAKAVENISRVDLINRSIQHLTSYANTLRADASRNNPDLERIDAAIKDLETEIEALKVSCDNKTSELTNAKEEIRRLTEIIQGQENLIKFEKQREQANTEIAKLDEDLLELKRRRQKFVRQYITVFNLFPEMMRVHEYIQKAKDADQLPPPIDKTLLAQYLDKGVCGICGHALNASATKKIEALCEMLKVGTKISHRLSEIDVSISHYVDMVRDYPSVVDGLKQQQRMLESKRKDAIVRLNEADEFLAKVGDGGKVKQSIEDRASFESVVARLQDDIPVLAFKIGEKDKELQNKRSEYDQAIARVNGLQVARQKLEFLENALTCMESVRHDMVEEVRSGIENETNQRLGALMWKPEYGRFTLSQQYAADLILKHETSHTTYSILSTRSMGERNILANAFTLALHSVSGFESFLCVDTPVARLSPEFRKRVAATWVEISKGCQLIFFLTPSEYQGEVRKGFEGRLASLRKIEFKNDVSQLKEVVL